MGISPEIAAPAVYSSHALIVDKPGSPSLLLSASDQPVPTFAAGQTVSVNGNVGHLGGTVASVHVGVDVTRTAASEVRIYTTRVVLS